MEYIVIFIYLIPGILNFTMLNDFVEELDGIWTNKRWKRIILRLTWILLWPMYVALYILLLGWCGITYFIKEIIK